MKLIKTVLEWEAGCQRVTPFGTLTFNHNGVCAINDDELAQKVANSSRSLVMGDESPEEMAKLLETLKAEDEVKNAPKDDKSLGEFMANAAHGVLAVSDEAQKQIGVPATDSLEKGVEDNGTFTPLVELTETTPAAEPGEEVGENVKNSISTEDFAASLSGYGHAQLLELLEQGNVDLSKYSAKEKQSKKGLIKIACDIKQNA